MPAKAAVKAAVPEATVFYDTVELSAIVAVFREEIVGLIKDLRDAKQRIGELEEQATKP